MYVILSQRTISEFIEATDHKAYISNCKYFSLKNLRGNKKSNYDSIAIWTETYNAYDNTPLYMGIMTDHFYYNNCEDIINHIKITKWHIPTHISEEALKDMLPLEKRLWVGEEYFKHIWNEVENHNFKTEPFLEIKLDGN